MLSKHNQERLNRLKRRRNWLWMRCKDNPEKYYDKSEASALDWAITYIQVNEGLESDYIKGLNEEEYERYKI